MNLVCTVLSLICSAIGLLILNDWAGNWTGWEPWLIAAIFALAAANLPWRHIGA